MERATRYSKKREAILTAIRSSDAHPSAEWIYHTLKSTHPDLSLGTVYRNLQQMAREGRLTELDGPVTRFDAVTRPHTHFRCRACGALRSNRIAADDNPALLLSIALRPLAQPPFPLSSLSGVDLSREMRHNEGNDRQEADA